AHPVTPWILSGRTQQALRGQAGQLLSHLQDAGEENAPAPVDIGFSCATTRAMLEHCAVVLAEDHAGFRRGLTALAEGRETAEVIARTQDAGQGGTVFVFPGQGSQWAGMAAELLDQEPVFAEAMAQCHRALEPFTEFSLLEVVRAEGAELERVEVVQPVLWAVMVSLARLWASVGVVPAAVVGHSQGEIAAAVVAGGLSLDDGARVVALRARAVARDLAGQGGMVSLALPVLEAQELAARWQGLSVAVVNGPGSTVVSGDADAVEELLAHCAEEGIRARRIPVDYASHCAQVEQIRERLLHDLAPVTPVSSTVPFYSTVTGRRKDTAGLDADYWYDNLRNTVRFEEVTRTLLTEGRTLFLEVSPHPGLNQGISESVESLGLRASVLCTLRRGEGGARRWLTAVAEAAVHGVRVDWAAVYAGRGGTRVELPTYAFQRRRYWLDTVELEPPAADHSQDRFWSAVEQEDLPALQRMLDVSGRTPLEEALSALSAWHRRDRERSRIESWRYATAWTPAQLPAGRLDGRWVVAVPPDHRAHPMVTAVTETLAAAGAAPELLPVSHQDERGALAERLRGASGVLSLLFLTDGHAPGHPATPAAFALTITLLHAAHDTGEPLRLWCATSGAVAAGPGDTVTHPDQALTWGLGRVTAHEYTQWGGLVDLPAEPEPRALARLAAVLAGTDEDQAAIRATGVFVPRLRRAEPTPLRRVWQPTGTVLVTGGTGGVGAHVARWLAASGAEHLLLLSRRGPEA
ncbi:hypothetical protein B5180_21820, partial [Streptomyces sp. BF-3]